MLAATNEGFSLPLLVAAALVSAAWVAGAIAVWFARRPPAVVSAPPTMELGPEPPAIAALLCGDYQVRSETAPAITLDLAARELIELEEVQPGNTICRVPASPPAGLAVYEQLVFDALRSKATDGVVPASALTTGTEAASTRWHRNLAIAVILDAQARGLVINRWPKRLVSLIGIGALPIGGLLVLSGQVGGTAGDRPVVGGIAGAVAVGGLLILLGLSGRLASSPAQRPTPAGSAAQARWLGVRAHLEQNPSLPELPAAAVKLYGRHLAYAAGFGIADRAVQELPYGEEDDELAWSTQGGRWHRVHVRYPRVIPPTWGWPPVGAVAVGILAIGGPGYLLGALATSSNHPHVRGALVVVTALMTPIAWGIAVLWRAVPDLFTTTAVTGVALRCRMRPRMLSSNKDPQYHHYVAIDDGSRDRITAFRVSPARYESVYQGELLTAEITPRLGHVRTWG